MSDAVFLALDNACTAAQVAMGKKSTTGKELFFTSNHVFVFISCPGLPKEDIASEELMTFMKECITEEVDNHKSILAKHQINEVEMVYESIDGHKRIVIRDETGVTTEVITEFPETLGTYPTVSVVDKKRFAARRVNSSYIYDFPIIFGMAAVNSWKAAESLDKDAYNKSVELLSADMAAALNEGRWRDFFSYEERVFENGKLEYISDAARVQELSNRAKYLTQATMVLQHRSRAGNWGRVLTLGSTICSRPQPHSPDWRDPAPPDRTTAEPLRNVCPPGD